MIAENPSLLKYKNFPFFPEKNCVPLYGTEEKEIRDNIVLILFNIKFNASGRCIEWRPKSWKTWKRVTKKAWMSSVLFAPRFVLLLNVCVWWWYQQLFFHVNKYAWCSVDKVSRRWASPLGRRAEQIQGDHQPAESWDRPPERKAGRGHRTPGTASTVGR